MQYSVSLNILSASINRFDEELDVEHLFLLTVLLKYTASFKYQQNALKEDDRLYFWFSMETIANDYPILTMVIRSEDAKKKIDTKPKSKAAKIRRMVSRLEKFGYMTQHPLDQQNYTSRFAFTEKASKLLEYSEEQKAEFSKMGQSKTLSQNCETPYNRKVKPLSQNCETPITELYGNTNNNYTNNNYTNNKEKGKAFSFSQNENVFEFENENEKERNENPNSHYSTDSKLNNEGGEVDVATLIQRLESISTEYYENQYKSSKAQFKALISIEAKNNDLKRFNEFCLNLYQNMISKQKVNPAAILAANFEGEKEIQNIFQGRGKKSIWDCFNAKEIPTLPTALIEFGEAFNGWYINKLTKEGADMSRTAVLAQIAKLEILPIEFLRRKNVIGNAMERKWAAIIHDEDQDNTDLQFWLRKNNAAGTQSNFQKTNKPRPSDYGGGCTQANIDAILKYYDNREKERNIEVRKAFFTQMKNKGVDIAAILRDFRGVEVGANV